MTEQKPPLWEVMRDAYDVSPPLPVDANLDQINRNGYAAEIRALRDWLAAEPVACETIKQDSFGRWLARIFRADGSDLSAALLAAGHASLFSAPKDL